MDRRTVARRVGTAVLASGVLLLGSPAASFAAQPPGQLGYEGQPGNQGGQHHHGNPGGLQGYEGQPGNQGGH
jgi:hypothetical protein